MFNTGVVGTVVGLPLIATSDLGKGGLRPRDGVGIVDVGGIILLVGLNGGLVGILASLFDPFYQCLNKYLNGFNIKFMTFLLLIQQ